MFGKDKLISNNSVVNHRSRQSVSTVPTGITLEVEMQARHQHEGEVGAHYHSNTRYIVNWGLINFHPMTKSESKIRILELTTF